MLQFGQQLGSQILLLQLEGRAFFGEKKTKKKKERQEGRKKGKKKKKKKEREREGERREGGGREGEREREGRERMVREKASSAVFGGNENTARARGCTNSVIIVKLLLLRRNKLVYKCCPQLPHAICEREGEKKRREEKRKRE